MESRPLHIRALYTVNSAPQYILAKSFVPIPVTILPNPQNTHDDHPGPLYGKVLLKSCLDAICQSSPELIPDARRDFSVYVLDPLESTTPNVFGVSQSHPHGVAIGLGLLSWALDDRAADTHVVGTLYSDGFNQDSLEVIFALRETTHVPLPQMRAHPSHAGIPVNDSLPPTSQSVPPLATPELKSAPNLSDPTFQSILLALASAGNQPSHLLTALSSIDSSGNPPAPNLALIEALSKLLAPHAAIDSSSPATHPPSASPAISSSPSRASLRNALNVSTTSPSKAGSDDEIVILDKESVNTAAFSRKRRSEKENSISTSSVPLAKEIRPPPLGSQPHPHASSSTSSRLTVPSQPAKLSRKRTLDDVMEAKEREDNWKRASAYSSKMRRTTEHSSRHTQSSGASSSALHLGQNTQRKLENAHYRRELLIPMSSPPRKKDYYTRDPSLSPPPKVTSSPSLPRSNGKGKQVAETKVVTRKPFVQPEWAKTTTATVPRFANRPPPPPENTKDVPVPKKRGRKKKSELPQTAPPPPPRIPDQRDSHPPLSDRNFPATSSSRRLHPIIASESDLCLFDIPAEGPLRCQSEPLECPSTPPRRAKSIECESPGLFGSPLFTPGQRRTPRTPHKTSASPAKLPSLYSTIDELFTPSARKTPLTSWKPPAGRTPRGLPLEPGSFGTDEADTPPSSLPVASSDAEFDALDSEVMALSEEDQISEEQYPGGLPPSSPPPSSPLPASSPLSSPRGVFGQTDESEGLNVFVLEEQTVIHSSQVAAGEAGPYFLDGAEDPFDLSSIFSAQELAEFDFSQPLPPSSEGLGDFALDTSELSALAASIFANNAQTLSFPEATALDDGDQNSYFAVNVTQGAENMQEMLSGCML